MSACSRRRAGRSSSLSLRATISDRVRLSKMPLAWSPGTSPTTSPIASSVRAEGAPMPVAGFQHINIRSADVERTRDFHVRIVGLRVGDRPPFQSIGYWLYLGDQPIVHLVQRNPGDIAPIGSGNLDHIAFQGIDIEATRATLMAAGIPFHEQIVPRDQTRQIFVVDPDGIKVEMNFESAARS